MKIKTGLIMFGLALVLSLYFTSLNAGMAMVDIG